MDQCRICGWTGNGRHYTPKEMWLAKGENFDYFVCGECGCLQIKTLPEDLSIYYGEDYYSFGIPDSSGAGEVKKTNEQRVLDVGCGAGSFLCKLAKNGYIYLQGCDPFIKEDIRYVNGVRIFKKSIHDMTGEFDLINFGDSFEHMADPDEVLRSAYRLLSADGSIRIDVPIFPNIAFDMFQERWYEIDAPRHIFVPTKKSLEYLAEKNHLKIIKWEYNSDWTQFAKSFLWAKDIPFKAQTMKVIKGFFSDEVLEEFQRKSQAANEMSYGDHAALWMVKTDKS